MGDVRPEYAELIRAMARRDWSTAKEARTKLDELGWPGGEVVIKATFALAVGRRFQPDEDVQVITQFVRDVRSQYEDGDEIPVMEGEVLVQAALGETDLAEGVDWETAIPTMIVMIGKLLTDTDYTDGELTEFVSGAISMASQHIE